MRFFLFIILSDGLIHCCTTYLSQILYR